MDKQDAIDFIVQEYENGRSPSEITELLSEQLKAPIDVCSRFVSRTLDQRLSFLENAEPAAPEPTPPPAAPKPASPASASPPAWEAYAPAQGALPPKNMEAQNPPAAPPEYGATATAGSGFQSLDEFDLAAISTGAAIPPPAQPTSAQPAPEEIDPRMEKFILEQLGKNRKESDVIMAVCERAGIGWPEAQRMVARVGALQRKKIAARRNRLIIPFSLGTIAVGLGLAFAGIDEMRRLAPFMEALEKSGVGGAVQALPADFMTRSFWALGIGAALIIGGLIGLIRAIRAGMD